VFSSIGQWGRLVCGKLADLSALHLTGFGQCFLDMFRSSSICTRRPPLNSLRPLRQTLRTSLTTPITRQFDGSTFPGQAPLHHLSLGL
jgi:hypothetical protein